MPYGRSPAVAVGERIMEAAVGRETARRRQRVRSPAPPFRAQTARSVRVRCRSRDPIRQRASREGVSERVCVEVRGALAGVGRACRRERVRVQQLRRSRAACGDSRRAGRVGRLRIRQTPAPLLWALVLGAAPPALPRQH